MIDPRRANPFDLYKVEFDNDYIIARMKNGVTIKLQTNEDGGFILKGFPEVDKANVNDFGQMLQLVRTAIKLRDAQKNSQTNLYELKQSSGVAGWLISNLLPEDIADAFLGDLDEILATKNYARENRAKVRIWLWRQVLFEIGPALKFQVRRLCSGFLKLVGFSQAIEWLFSKF